MADVLGELREMGMRDQVTTLLQRNPAAHVSLVSPFAVTALVNELREMGAQDQVTTLLQRDPAANVFVGMHFDEPYLVAGLLRALQDAGRARPVGCQSLPGL